MTDTAQTTTTITITKEEIEEYGGVVLLGELPETFPFSSEEVFRQIATGHMLRIEDGVYCWKKTPFQMKGYVGSLGKVEKKQYSANFDPVMEILDGQTIDINVYEVRELESKKKSKTPPVKIETHLKVLHERDATGKNIGKYFVKFEFNNAGTLADYQVTYEDRKQSSHSVGIGTDLNIQGKILCFKTHRTLKPTVGLKCQEELPKTFLVEDFLKLVQKDNNNNNVF